MLACKGRISQLTCSKNGVNTPGGKQSRNSGWVMHKFVPQAHLREEHFSAATPEARVERRALLAQQAKLRGETVCARSPLAVLNYMDENASPAPARRVAACQRVEPNRAAAQSKIATEQALLDLCQHLLSDQQAQSVVLQAKSTNDSEADTASERDTGTGTRREVENITDTNPHTWGDAALHALRTSLARLPMFGLADSSEAEVSQEIGDEAGVGASWWQALLGLSGSGTSHMKESKDIATNKEDVDAESSRYAVEQVAFEMLREFYAGVGAGLNDAKFRAGGKSTREVDSLATELAQDEAALRELCTENGLSSTGDAATMRQRIMCGLGWGSEELRIGTDRARRILAARQTAGAEAKRWVLDSVRRVSERLRNQQHQILAGGVEACSPASPAVMQTHPHLVSPLVTTPGAATTPAHTGTPQSSKLMIGEAMSSPAQSAAVLLKLEQLHERITRTPVKAFNAARLRVVVKSTPPAAGSWAQGMPAALVPKVPVEPVQEQKIQQSTAKELTDKQCVGKVTKRVRRRRKKNRQSKRNGRQSCGEPKKDACCATKQSACCVQPAPASYAAALMRRAS